MYMKCRGKDSPNGVNGTLLESLITRRARAGTGTRATALMVLVLLVLLLLLFLVLLTE